MEAGCAFHSKSCLHLARSRICRSVQKKFFYSTNLFARATWLWNYLFIMGLLRLCGRWKALPGSPVDKVEEVLNHPRGRVCHLRQQEPVDDPVGVPAGHRAAPVSAWVGWLTDPPPELWPHSSDITRLRHSPVVQLPEASSGHHDRVRSVYLWVELRAIFNVDLDLGDKSVFLRYNPWACVWGCRKTWRTNNLQPVHLHAQLTGAMGVSLSSRPCPT